MEILQRKQEIVNKIIDFFAKVGKRLDIKKKKNRWKKTLTQKYRRNLKKVYKYTEEKSQMMKSKERFNQLTWIRQKGNTRSHRLPSKKEENI